MTSLIVAGYNTEQWSQAPADDTFSASLDLEHSLQDVWGLAMTQFVSLDILGSPPSLATGNLSDNRVCVALGPGELNATTFPKTWEAAPVQTLHKPENLRGEAGCSAFHLT